MNALQPLTTHVDKSSTTTQSDIAKVIAELADQAIHPPAGDVCIGACYDAMHFLVQSNHSIKGFFTDVLSHRKFVPKHFVNLFFRVIQYVELYERRNLHYPAAFGERSTWVSELEYLLLYHRDSLFDHLLSRDTQTTKYQRYAGPLAVMSALLPREPLTVADFGCGGNHGLPGIAAREPFGFILDFTRGHLFTCLLNQVTSIQQGLAIDKIDPLDPDSATWRLACSLYPSELGSASTLLDLEKRLARGASIGFMQCNLADRLGANDGPSLVRGSFHAVIISTMLYQLDECERQIVLENARDFLRPDGIIIVQNFARKSCDASNLSFESSWFSEPGSYRCFVVGTVTGWNIKEVLRWDSGRCHEVHEGEDFYILCEN